MSLAPIDRPPSWFGRTQGTIDREEAHLDNVLITATLLSKPTIEGPSQPTSNLFGDYMWHVSLLCSTIYCQCRNSYRTVNIMIALLCNGSHT